MNMDKMISIPIGIPVLKQDKEWALSTFFLEEKDFPLLYKWLREDDRHKKEFGELLKKIQEHNENL